MKKILFSILILFTFTVLSRANGVIIKDATEAVYFKLLNSTVEVTINNQVAIVTSRQIFLNNVGESENLKYAFPLHPDASPTNLKWFVNGAWHTAIFAPSPQDTTLPGGSDPDPALMAYLGDTPMLFNIPDTIMMDSLITMELTYVQLLPYDFGIVSFNFPNDYQLIQSEYLDFQILDLSIQSDRTIENVELLSHPNATIVNNGYWATVYYEEFESVANTNYDLEYQLSADELGLFPFSTYLPDSANTCDELGNGFLAFVVEPDPGDSLDVIDKVFTLIVDRSGSMSGDKIVQARNAASFIINHLNEGDYFNIVDFASDVSSFSDDHVPFNNYNKNQALNYISQLNASSSTNISGAFTNAIADFAGNDTTVANIIIFFTDGQPTAGITSTSGILASIEQDLTYNEVNFLAIHSFGIGEDVNQQLLTLISAQNNGLAQFLLDSELEEMITAYYLRIRNPVLLNIEMSFDPPMVSETYPDPLTNLYLGQQLIVVGRYNNPSPVLTTFEGHAFGQTQTYQYNFNLSDSIVEDNQFLTKIWAKGKIEHLYVEYFNYPPNSTQAEEIKEEIIDISMCYNVLSPFTHFSGGGGTTTEIDDSEYPEYAEQSMDTYCYPNPFTGETKIHLKVTEAFFGNAIITIYDAFGRTIQELTIDINGPGDYSVPWNGKNNAGNIMPTGHYFYSINYGSISLKGHIVMF